MKHIFLILFAVCIQNNIMATNTAPLETQKEAVDIVTAIAHHVTELVIHHKTPSDPKVTKEHSIGLIKEITAIITTCIMNAQSKKTTKQFPLYNQETLNEMIEQLADSVTQKILTT